MLGFLLLYLQRRYVDKELKNISNTKIVKPLKPRYVVDIANIKIN